MGEQDMQGWIERAIADARKQSWFAFLGSHAEEQVRRDLQDWADDGLFRTERQVRDRLCQFCQEAVRQIGRANFRCSI